MSWHKLTQHDKQLLLDSLTIATGHWAKKGDKQPAWSDERSKAYGNSNQFSDLRDKLSPPPFTD